METIANIWAKYLFNPVDYIKDLRNKEKRMFRMHPIIYSKKYNIKAFGMEKMHPFPSDTPSKIY